MNDTYLAQFKPSLDIFSQFEISPSLSGSDKAFKSWQLILQAKQSYEGLFLVIGKLLKSFRDEKLYKQLDYETFTDFLASEELGFSREKAYMCIKVYEYFIEYLELNPEAVGKMNISRLAQMVPELKKIEDRDKVVEKIEEYNSLRLGDFVREIKKGKEETGKPSVYWSEERELWVINFYSNTTEVNCLGEYEK